MKLTGTHTAEQGPDARPRSCGQAFNDSLESNTAAVPRRTATQENGDFTWQPGASMPGLEATRERFARLESDSSSSIGVCSEISSVARSTTLNTSRSSSAISSASPKRLAKPSRCSWAVSSLLELHAVGRIACVEDDASEIAVGSQIGRASLEVAPLARRAEHAEAEIRRHAGGLHLLERGTVVLVDEAHETTTVKLGVRPSDQRRNRAADVAAAVRTENDDEITR